MAAKQGVEIILNNPKAKYRINYIKYRIYNKDGTYTDGTKKFITRKKDEWTNEENKQFL